MKLFLATVIITIALASAGVTIEMFWFAEDQQQQLGWMDGE